MTAMSKAHVSPQPPLHVYQRIVAGDSQDSLAVIAEMIQPGQTILDLGMGAGGLGQYLALRQSVVADGVTLNPTEAGIASAWYRHALVADLDNDDIGKLFGDNRYDCIVCADVLEHLKAPQNVLAQCRALLKPGGRLLTSVPNAGYCGLVAELIAGDFRYRPEGLLDVTHLRFFTRTSLQRFFDGTGWATQSIKTIQRSLLASEFKLPFDNLPPAVVRHLLALPDALTYQFISELQPAEWANASSNLAYIGPSGARAVASGEPDPATSLFSAQLYLATLDQYQEATKLVAAGKIGDPKQTLSFDIPASQQPYTQVRFDPADRPGFFRLHDVQLRLQSGELVWQWQAGQDSVAILANSPNQHILVSGPWEMSSGALLLLLADDPWVELPLPQDVLHKVSQSGARLEVCAGWPMSADYLHASTTINSLQASHEQSSALTERQLGQLKQKNAQLEDAQLQLQTKLEALSLATQEVQSEKLHLTEYLHSVQSQAKAEEVRLTAQLSEAHLETQHERNLLNGLRATQLEAQTEKQHLIAELRTTQRERNTHLAQFNQVALHLESVKSSTMFRVTRPLSNMKGRFDRLLGRGPRQNLVSRLNPKTQAIPVSKNPVDIIVPVYRSLQDTRRCLESVLAAPGQSTWRLIVINDCSPEAEVTEWLRAFALRDPRITLLENSENLGFVGTVNRGMAFSQDNDVLLLNNDAEVANDWLDRIQRAAYSGARVASVTPFSNNATIFSYPRFCEVNEMPRGYDTSTLDRLFARHLAGQSVEVPTAVGFCMYIRRQCLYEIGFFDIDNFGKGYGEENDFCVRAQSAGWTNLHALDTFVRHAGGVSFGDSKGERELAAMQTIRRLHPSYESDVHAFIKFDPARQARMVIDVARIIASGRPVILLVMHNREGGTLRHTRELTRKLGNNATFLRLTPAPAGVELKLEGNDETLALHFELPGEHSRLIQVLRQLRVCHIHYHHLLGHSSDIANLPTQLGVTHDFTAHDYYSYCPQISLTDHTERYCGELGLAQCHACLKQNPAPENESIESWRARHAKLISEARHVMTPSLDAAKRIHRFVPTANIVVVPHATLAPASTACPTPNPSPRNSARPLKIVVLGALGKIKGADMLEAVSILAAVQNAPVEFHLLGYGYRSLRAPPRAQLTVHGPYIESDLPGLLRSLAPDAVWFPAQCPETYSYTLSTAIELGLPVVAPNLGSFPERLAGREWTWICPWDQTPEQWLQLFVKLDVNHFQTGTAPQAFNTTESETAVKIDLDHYSKVYASNISAPATANTEEVLSVALELLTNQSEKHSYEKSSHIKGLILRSVIRMRASPILSVVAYRTPGHLQRRVKSWLQS